MGQKVHPHGMRVGVIKNWSSKWYADSKDFAKFVIEDNKIRKELKKELYQARISDMIIERTNSEVRVTLHTAKPGLVIGKNGAQLEELKKKLQKELDRVNKKLSNEKFVGSAPEAVVAKEKEKQTTYQEQYDSVKERIAALDNLK